MSKYCVCCGEKLYNEPLMVCERMPKSAQFFPALEDIADDLQIDLRLMQCSGCGLVQLDVEPVCYYKNVIRSGGYSSTMYNLRKEEYTRFLKLCPISNKRLIEVGCGQGEFLRVWREESFPVEVYGIENDERLVQLAIKDKLCVFQGFTENEYTNLKGAPYDGFCSFNFLEHQSNPNTMLRCIYNNLKEEAYGLITVPSFEYILEQESYYELIRDHIAYYTKDTLCFLLEKNGFHVISCELINRDTWEAIVEKKRKINTDSLIMNKIQLTKEIQQLVTDLLSHGKRMAVWGASHQGLTILSSMSLEKDVAYVVDSAPFKQNKFTIGSHIAIVPPTHILEDKVDAILIIAPGYTEEIFESIKSIDGSIAIYALRGNHLQKYY